MTIHTDSPGAGLKKDRPVQTVDHNSFAPLAFIVVFTLLVMVGFQTLQIINERKILKNTKIGQEGSFQESKKLRAQLDSIASQTALLASQDNPNAKIIIEALKKRKITINPKGQTAN